MAETEVAELSTKMSDTTDPEPASLTTNDEDETLYAPTLERDIKRFVATKTGERVFLNLSQKCTVAIKHVRKSGSTVLAIFWIKVLQHPNNYPVQHFPYRKLYKGGRRGEDSVVLTVDGVKVTVFMTSGTLQITGAFAIEWFVDRFSGVMAAYDAPKDKPQPLRHVFSPEQIARLESERRRIMQKYGEDWPDAALRAEVNVVRDGEEKSAQITRADNPRLPDLVNDHHVYVHSDPDVLEATDLCVQIERLKTGTSVDGPTLYRLWKSVLNSWFGDESGVVYVVTPRLDIPRLTNICRLFLNNRLTARLGAVCVPLEFDNSKMADIRRETISRFPPKDQVLIEYKIYENIVYPQKSYQAKFIACVKDDVAHVLLTTADFHGDHFLQSVSNTTIYQTLPESDFMMRYLGPILSSANVS